MPYKISGKTVYVKKMGKWRKKATAKSTASAKRMLKILRAVKYGGMKRRAKKK